MFHIALAAVKALACVMMISAYAGFIKAASDESLSHEKKVEKMMEYGLLAILTVTLLCA